MKLSPIIMMSAGLSLLLGMPAAFAGSTNGRDGSMPAYYDDVIFTVNFKELTGQSAAALISHNGSINLIYKSDTPLPDGSMFVAVLDAIQGDGFNPLWVEVEVDFASGVEPFQLTSDTDVEAAVEAGSITLNVTDEVYRCSVIGPRLHEKGSTLSGMRPSAEPNPVPVTTWSAVKSIISAH
jgi:hypothetical protein